MNHIHLSGQYRADCPACQDALRAAQNQIAQLAGRSPDLEKVSGALHMAKGYLTAIECTIKRQHLSSVGLPEETLKAINAAIAELTPADQLLEGVMNTAHITTRGGHE